MKLSLRHQRLAAIHPGWILPQGIRAVAAALLVSGQAAAGEMHARLELTPALSVGMTSDQAEGYLGVGASFNGELWGAGLLGIMLQVSEDAYISDVDITDEGLVPVTTNLMQLTLGPTANFVHKRAHVRLGLGPWLGYSWISSSTLQNLEGHEFVPDWSQARFMGGAVDARADFNLPFLSPFVGVQGRGHRLESARSLNEGLDEAQASGLDLMAQAGVRLNLIPLVKLGIVGFAGYTLHRIEPVFSELPDTTRVGGGVQLQFLLR